MAGRFFEEWSVGDFIQHDMRRTVTETDNLLITTLTHNTQPLHLDAEAAGASEFGRILVNGIFTFGLMIGVSVADTTHGTLIANLGYDRLIMPKPVFIGDTLRGETTVTELKESRSRPQAGIVTFTHRMRNQRDEVVCECLRTALIRRKGR
jgi:acyl dehydratase